MALSIAARRVDGVLRSSQGQRRDGSAVCPESPYFRKQFAARRGVQKGREDSLCRIRSATYILARRCDHPVFQTETSAL